MKKNILILLLSSFALTSCELPSFLTNLFGNKQDEQKENNLKPEEQHHSGDEQEEQEEERTEPGSERYTSTIELHGEAFGSLFSNGSDLTQTGNSNKFVSYLNTRLENQALLKSVSLVKCASRAYNNDVYFQLGTGNYTNNKFNPGSFTWTTSLFIDKVEVTAFNYSNPYVDPQTKEDVYNTDILSHIQIDGDDTSLEVNTGDEPKKVTATKEYSSPVKSFTMTCTGGRVLLEKLTIHWRS